MAEAKAVRSGTRSYLRHLVREGRAKREEIYFLMHPKRYPGAEEFLSDPEVVREADRFERRLLAKRSRSGASLMPSGALALLLFLKARCKTISELTPEEFRLFRRELVAKGGSTLPKRLSGARAYVRAKIRSGLLGEEILCGKSRTTSLPRQGSRSSLGRWRARWRRGTSPRRHGPPTVGHCGSSCASSSRRRRSPTSRASPAR